MMMSYFHGKFCGTLSFFLNYSLTPWRTPTQNSRDLVCTDMWQARDWNIVTEDTFEFCIVKVSNSQIFPVSHVFSNIGPKSLSAGGHNVMKECGGMTGRIYRVVQPIGSGSQAMLHSTGTGTLMLSNLLWEEIPSTAPLKKGARKSQQSTHIKANMKLEYLVSSSQTSQVWNVGNQ